MGHQSPLRPRDPQAAARRCCVRRAGRLCAGDPDLPQRQALGRGRQGAARRRSVRTSITSTRASKATSTTTISAARSAAGVSTACLGNSADGMLGWRSVFCPSAESMSSTVVLCTPENINRWVSCWPPMRYRSNSSMPALPYPALTGVTAGWTDSRHACSCARTPAPLGVARGLPLHLHGRWHGVSCCIPTPVAMIPEEMRCVTFRRFWP